MPRTERPAGALVPGAYETLLRAECERATAADPRGLFFDSEGFEAAQGDADAAAAELFKQRLTEAEPVVVERWRLGGNSLPLPPELVERVRQHPEWIVTADDRLLPRGN